MKLWKKTTPKALALLMVAAMLLSVLPMSAFAIPDTHTDHCVCGNNAAGIGDHTTCSDADWTAIYSQTALETLTYGYYYLTADITLTSPLELSSTIFLCLNGHTISSDSPDGTLTVADNHHVTVCDCLGTGAIENTSSGNAFFLHQKTGVHFRLYGGTLRSASGSAYEDNDGTWNAFSQYGGSVESGNTYGVNLCFGSSSYYLYGGSVKNTGSWAIYAGDGTNSVTLSGNVEIGNPIWITSSLFFAGALEKPAAPIAVRYTNESGSDIPGVITIGWSTYMAEADFRDYFVSYKPDRFEIVKDEVGELKMARLKENLTAANFTFTPPDDLICNAAEKTASVTAAPSVTGVGDITVKYYDESGILLAGAPAEAGTYTVKIDVAASDRFNAVTDLTDPGWTFTVSYLPTPETPYTVSGYAYNTEDTYYAAGSGVICLTPPEGYAIGTDPSGTFYSRLVLEAETAVPQQVWLRNSSWHITAPIDVTESFEFDATAPILEGIEDGKTYYGDLTVFKPDALTHAITSVTVDGEPLAFAEGNYGTIPADDQEHTVIVINRLGNITIYTVTVMKRHKVTFDFNGGNLGGRTENVVIELTEDGKLTDNYPTNLEKEDHAFLGWCNEDGEEIDPATYTYTDGETLTAQFAPTTSGSAGEQESEGTKQEETEPEETEPEETEPEETKPEETEPEETEPEETEPEETKPEETEPEETEPEETEPEETKPAGTDVPKTGDDSPLFMLSALAILSAAALFALLLTHRKKENA